MDAVVGHQVPEMGEAELEDGLEPGQLHGVAGTPQVAEDVGEILESGCGFTATRRSSAAPSGT